MAEYSHVSTIGSWFFQAVVGSSKLDRMTQNARAAHWNKPRAVRYRESALIGPTQLFDEEESHQVLLCGVRVIQGRTSPFPNRNGLGQGRLSDLSDVNCQLGVGDPQTLFPQGIGLPPFVRRPVVLCNLLGFQVNRESPEPSDTDPTDPDYSFVTWFGELDWGSHIIESLPDGTDYDITNLVSDEQWTRCVVARPITTTHTGEVGATDMTIGLRFRLIFGRVGGIYDWPFLVVGYQHHGAYYIHWQALGPVAAY